MQCSCVFWYRRRPFCGKDVFPKITYYWRLPKIFLFTANVASDDGSRVFCVATSLDMSFIHAECKNDANMVKNVTLTSKNAAFDEISCHSVPFRVRLCSQVMMEVNKQRTWTTHVPNSDKISEDFHFHGLAVALQKTR